MLWVEDTGLPMNLLYARDSAEIYFQDGSSPKIRLFKQNRLVTYDMIQQISCIIKRQLLFQGTIRPASPLYRFWDLENEGPWAKH